VEDCVFCRIVERSLPARILYEDDLVVAFHDVRPAAPIHVLIVPKRHVPTLNDVPDTDAIMSHLARIAKKIATDFGVAQTGYRFFFNVNRGGGQVVFHLHAHLVAGRDFGTRLITTAIAVAVVWRRLAGYLLRMLRPESRIPRPGARR
jgi:histidine triad (HIT) family protein